MPRRLAALALIFGVGVTAALAAPSLAGRLSQLPGTTGCVSANGSNGTCARGKGLFGASTIAVSPDGRHVYVGGDGVLGVYARSRATGALRYVSRVTGAEYFVAVAPDGKNVYATGTLDNSIVAFARRPDTGALVRLPGTDGCVSETGSGGRCADGRALFSPSWIATSPDGRHLYVVSHQSDSVAAFARDRQSGALTQLEGEAGCIGDVRAGCARGTDLTGAVAVVVTRDGKNVYLAAGEGERAPTAGLATFTRNPSTGALTQFAGSTGEAPESPSSIAAAAEGRSVYVGSVQGVSVYARSPATGALMKLAGKKGCLLDPARYEIDSCSPVRTLGARPWVTVTGDGKSVYVASEDGIAVFARDRRTSALTQLSGRDGCVDKSGRACGRARVLSSATSVAVSPDGRNVYVADGSANAVAVFRREVR